MNSEDKEQYLFSEKAVLLLWKTDDSWLVLNGGWSGNFINGIFQCDKVKECQVDVDDWVEIDPTKKSKAWQKEWYFR